MMGFCLVDGIVMFFCVWFVGVRDGMYMMIVEKVR